MDAQAMNAVIGNVRPETFLGHWREIRDAKDNSHDASTAVSRAKKAAKRDGVDLDVVAIMEKLHDMDTDERELFLRKMVVYFQWLDMPLGAFAEGIKAPAPKDSAREQFGVWQAGQDGLTAGKAGRKREDNPHRAGTEVHVSWDKAWARGFKNSQKKLAGDLAKNAGRGKGRAAKGNGAEARA
jgi:hypothetical protein